MPDTIEGNNGGTLTPTQEGDVLNPYGRAGKDGTGGKFNVRTVLEKYLSVQNEEGVDQLELITADVIKQAREGSLKAADMVYDRLDGKPIATQIGVNVDAEDYMEVIRARRKETGLDD